MNDYKPSGRHCEFHSSPRSSLISTLLLMLAACRGAGAVYDVSHDFSATSNPSGPWSYGAKASLDGSFSLFGIHGITAADGGVPIQYWQLVALQEEQTF
jgi:hypothetical protein